MYLEFSYIFIPLFFLLSFVLFIRTKRDVGMSNRRILLFLVLLPIINIFFINPDLNSYLSYSCLLFIPASYCTIKSGTFLYFREKWLKYMRWLCVISILVQVMHDLGVINPGGADIRNNPTTLYFFNCDWGMYRLSSVFWEPGQFQILLITTLCLFTDELAKWNKVKSILKRFGAILLALIMTLSTTGYLCFMILIISIALFPRQKTLSIKTKLFSLLFSTGFVILLILSSAVQEKVEQSQDLSQNSSTTVRLADNLALISAIAESPWLGYGIDSKKQKDALEKHGTFTSSNGWLYSASGYGIVYVVVILVCIYMKIKKMPRSIPPYIIWITFFLSQCNEYIIFFPYLYLFLFDFKRSTKVIQYL